MLTSRGPLVAYLRAVRGTPKPGSGPLTAARVQEFGAPDLLGCADGSPDEQAERFLSLLRSGIAQARLTDDVDGIVLHHFFFGTGQASERQSAAVAEARCSGSTPRNIEKAVLARLADILLASTPAAAVRDYIDEDSPLGEITAALAEVAKLDPQRLTALVPVEQELRRVIVHSYRKLRALSEASTFFTYMSTLRLRTLHYDPLDTLLILSRRDKATGIEQDAEWRYYVDWMQDRIDDGEQINHKRVVVRPSHVSAREVTDQLRPYHKPDTLFSISSERVATRHRFLSDFSYGLAISTVHRLALISIPPAPVTQPHRLDPEPGSLRQLIEGCREYDPYAGPMQAVVTADPVYVGRLIAAFNDLVDDRPHTKPI